MPADSRTPCYTIDTSLKGAPIHRGGEGASATASRLPRPDFEPTPAAPASQRDVKRAIRFPARLEKRKPRLDGPTFGRAGGRERTLAIFFLAQPDSLFHGHREGGPDDDAAGPTGDAVRFEPQADIAVDVEMRAGKAHCDSIMPPPGAAP